MPIKNTILRATSVALLVGLPWACSVVSDESQGDRIDSGAAEDSPVSFESYREAARTTVDGGEVFIVEDDMLFDSEEALRAYYDELNVKLKIKSVVNSRFGGREAPTNIRYCFVSGWGQNQGTYTAPLLASVRDNIQLAMAEWESVANIKFVYASNLDGASCTTAGVNPGLDFVVEHWDEASRAVGPFPYAKWSNQRFRVPTTGITRVLALHELGHVLGFRHEHIHSGATPRCGEGGAFTELTPFDTDSIMKYADCTQGSTIEATQLSALDATGARRMYGPTIGDSLYLAENGGVWRTDNDDGVPWRVNADWSVPTSMTTFGSSLYLVRDAHLHKLDPFDGGADTVLGGASWSGTTTMAAINGSLYITQDQRLWRITSLSTGTYAPVGSGDWTGATSMVALGSWLYIVQNSRLHKVNPSDGTYAVLGGASWPGPTAMAALGGSLFITQDDGLWKITSLSTGVYTRVGSADWTDSKSMAALGSSLYIIQDPYLHRVNPSDGTFVVLRQTYEGTVMSALP